LETQGVYTLLSHLRRFPRVRLNTQVAIRYGDQLGLAFSADVSEGGLGLSWPLSPPALGDFVQVSFYLPNRREPLNARAVVVHHQALEDGNGLFGVQFTELEPELRRPIRRYVNMRRFVYGDLRKPSRDPVACQRMSERLHRVRVP
jgi:c-di-GMP-binding flagellar brake protein YcgR